MNDNFKLHDGTDILRMTMKQIEDKMKSLNEPIVSNVSNHDKYLLLGFIACCIGILFLSWSLAKPMCESASNGSIVKVLNCD